MNDATRRARTDSGPAGQGQLPGSHPDIQDRTRAEAAILESRRLYEDLVSSVPLGVYRVEPADGGFRFVYVNDRYCSTLGLTREAIMADARATIDIIHPSDRSSFEQLNEHALVHGRPFNWEGRITVGGGTRWVHVDAHPSRDLTGMTNWTGFVMDVTTRRLADDALRSSEYFLGRSQEAGRLGSFEFDIPGGTWTCTATLDDILGLDHRNPKLFSEWVDRVAPDMREEMLSYVTEHVIGGRHRFDREYRIVRPRDGVERWVSGLAEVEFDAAGQPRKMIGTIQDVTDRRRAEEERLALERQLQHSQKLESLGVLAGGIAHDFNNLLMAILGNLDLALSQISPVSAARASIEHSLTAARRATDLTRQMLAYSGKAAFDVRAVDLNEIVHENAHLLRACIPKLVRLTLDLGEPLHAIVADAGQVQQVIMNLITNAAEAIGDHAGVITLTTRMQDVDAGALRASRVEEVPESGRFVCLEVSDTGCGMDAHTQQRLFDPFFTTKLMGRGLGMSAILGIVRGHRGAIMVDSEPGTGSCIRVLFPASVALPASARPARTGDPADEAPGMPARGFVLVVDDEDMVRDVCRRMLQQAGWAVLDADGGLSAIDVFAAHANEVACVILDLSMPHMDGFGVFRALRAIRPDVRVILSSGYSRNHEPGTDLAAEGFAGFIQKPYSAKTLRDEVARVVTGTPAR